jgi:hypothetical protein
VSVAVRPARVSPDAAVGPAAVTVLGCTTVAALGALAAQQQTLAVAAAGLAGIALLVVLAGGWIDCITVLVIPLPLPALLAAGNLRLAPAAPITAVVIAAWFLAWGPSRRRLSTGAIPVLLCLAFLLADLLAGTVSDHRGAALREIANLVLIGTLLVVATDTFSRRPGGTGIAPLAIAGTADPVQASLRRAALWTLAIFCAEGMVDWPLSLGHAQLIVIAAAMACTATVTQRGAVIVPVGTAPVAVVPARGPS